MLMRVFEIKAMAFVFTKRTPPRIYEPRTKGAFLGLAQLLTQENSSKSNQENCYDAQYKGGSRFSIILVLFIHVLKYKYTRVTIKRAFYCSSRAFYSRTPRI